MNPRLVLLDDPGLARDSYLDPIRAAGGLWAPAAMGIQMRELISEARDRRVRALQLPGTDESLAEALPDLEFLIVTGPRPDARIINRLAGLRLLQLWSAPVDRLDLGALPRLEWLLLGDCDAALIDALSAGHRMLGHLHVTDYPVVDLAPCAGLPLLRLSVVNGRRLVRLDPVTPLADTLTGLELSLCPSLPSLDGIEGLANLEVLELSNLRQITTLDWVQRLPRLRLLNVFDLKNVESLRPLAGHPSLEFVTFGRTRDLDLVPLATIPNLKLILTGSYRWNRDVHDFPHMDNFPSDHPVQQEYARLLHG